MPGSVAKLWYYSQIINKFIFWKFFVFKCTVIAHIVEKHKFKAKFGLSAKIVCYKYILCNLAGQNSNNFVKIRVEIEKASGNTTLERTMY